MLLMATARHAIRAMREAQGISIRELARRADVDHTYLSRFEAGKLAKEPTNRWLRAVSDALGNHLAERCDVA